MSATKRVLVCHNDEWYDVTDFNHPGEGIKDVYLKNFHHKKIDEQLHKAHETNEPYELLQEAKEKGSCDGIVYVGSQPEPQSQSQS